MDDLERFVAAQDGEGGLMAARYVDAIAELRAGRKTSHWIWYVFPQLGGLGHSGMAVRYGLDGTGEAEDYLRHPVLRARLVEAVEAVHAHVVEKGAPVRAVMGSGIDAQKLVSSLTLFEAVARRLAASPGAEAVDGAARLADLAGQVLAAARAQGLRRCAVTEDVLEVAYRGR